MFEPDAEHRSDGDYEEPDLDDADDGGKTVTENAANDDDLLYLKYCFDGAASISQVATALRRLADDRDRRASAGWSLVDPVDGGYVHLSRTPVSREG